MRTSERLSNKLGFMSMQEIAIGVFKFSENKDHSGSSIPYNYKPKRACTPIALDITVYKQKVTKVGNFKICG